jgi:hypothetical protein
MCELVKSEFPPTQVDRESGDEFHGFSEGFSPTIEKKNRSKLLNFLR